MMHDGSFDMTGMMGAMGGGMLLVILIILGLGILIGYLIGRRR